MDEDFLGNPSEILRRASSLTKEEWRVVAGYYRMEVRSSWKKTKIEGHSGATTP